MDFEQYWRLIGGDVQFADRKTAAEEAWHAHPEKQASIIAWLKKHGAYKGRNPYFFILDWQVKHIEGTPTDYNNQPLPSVPVFSSKYKGKWGMYTQEDIDKYHLEKAKGQ